MAAPAPTELLAEDIRDLRESNRLIVTEIKDLTTSVNGLRTEFAGFKASTEEQIKTIVGIGRWVTAGFIGGVITVGISAAGVIWAASA